jgi:hypothetical protein
MYGSLFSLHVKCRTLLESERESKYLLDDVRERENGRKKEE